jgi:hypothetical protein
MVSTKPGAAIEGESGVLAQHDLMLYTAFASHSIGSAAQQPSQHKANSYAGYSEEEMKNSNW